MIAVVAICKDEIDLADRWIQHYLAEGVDRIFVADASSDGTRDIFRQYSEVTVIDDTEPYCLQVQWTMRLMEMAGNEGAAWILPLDTDEFLYAVNGQTVANALAECPHEKLYVRSYLQYEDARVVAPKRLPKVCFRYSPGLSIAMGNHEVSIFGGAWDVLNIRELQFRSEEHYLQKVAARLATLDPSVEARGDAAHYTWLRNKGEHELRQEWLNLISVPMIADPIPTSVPRG